MGNRTFFVRVFTNDAAVFAVLWYRNKLFTLFAFVERKTTGLWDAHFLYVITVRAR